MPSPIFKHQNNCFRPQCQFPHGLKGGEKSANESHVVRLKTDPSMRVLPLPLPQLFITPFQAPFQVSSHPSKSASFSMQPGNTQRPDPGNMQRRNPSFFPFPERDTNYREPAAQYFQQPQNQNIQQPQNPQRQNQHDVAAMLPQTVFNLGGAANVPVPIAVASPQQVPVPVAQSSQFSESTMPYQSGIAPGAQPVPTDIGLEVVHQMELQNQRTGWNQMEFQSQGQSPKRGFVIAPADREIMSRHVVGYQPVATSSSRNLEQPTQPLPSSGSTTILSPSQRGGNFRVVGSGMSVEEYLKKQRSKSESSEKFLKSEVKTSDSFAASPPLQLPSKTSATASSSVSGISMPGFSMPNGQNEDKTTTTKEQQQKLQQKLFLQQQLQEQENRQRKLNQEKQTTGFLGGLWGGLWQKSSSSSLWQASSQQQAQSSSSSTQSAVPSKSPSIFPTQVPETRFQTDKIKHSSGVEIQPLTTLTVLKYSNIS